MENNRSVELFIKQERVFFETIVLEAVSILLVAFMERRCGQMNVKYIGNDTKVSEKGKIHVLEGGRTACGAVVDDNPKDWERTTASVTCEKNGCRMR